jgi:hypothetical protein
MHVGEAFAKSKKYATNPLNRLKQMFCNSVLLASSTCTSLKEGLQFMLQHDMPHSTVYVSLAGCSRPGPTAPRFAVLFDCPDTAAGGLACNTTWCAAACSTI